MVGLAEITNLTSGRLDVIEAESLQIPDSIGVAVSLGTGGSGGYSALQISYGQKCDFG